MTLEEAGYGQANFVQDIVSRLSKEFQYQANMVNSVPHEDTAPPIAGKSEFLQQVPAQNRELVQLIFSKDGKIGRNNTNRPPTNSTVPRQGQPCNPMPT